MPLRLCAAKHDSPLRKVGVGEGMWNNSTSSERLRAITVFVCVCFEIIIELEKWRGRWTRIFSDFQQILESDVLVVVVASTSIFPLSLFLIFMYRLFRKC